MRVPSFMKTLKGEDVDIAGYDNFADVAEGLTGPQ